MLAILAIGITVIAVLATGGAWIQEDSHGASKHHHMANTTHPSDNDTGCSHSKEGCDCYQAGYAQGRSWTEEEARVHED